MFTEIFTFVLGPRLFVKVLRPGDSEVTFAVFESISTSLTTKR